MQSAVPPHANVVRASAGIDIDPSERLSADDMASRREAEFLARALAAQAQAARVPGAVAGTCSNCGARCLPRAVYCDEECQQDHEWRLGCERRTGARR